MLRVLNLSFSWHKEVKLPKEIGKLIHLRLLSIRGVSITKIPSSIGNLRCLQTLKLALGRSKVVPSVIWKLEQLRHLHFVYVGIGEFEWLKTSLRSPNIRNLQTLTGVSTECFDYNDLLQLKKLKKLAIHLGEDLKRIYHDSPSVTFDCLRHLKLYYYKDDGIDIVPLILSYPRIYKLKMQGRIVKLPEDSQFSPNLIKLRLRETITDQFCEWQQKGYTSLTHSLEKPRPVF
ncbi:hypothetical protein CsatB_030904 [Cannabis sativa]